MLNNCHLSRLIAEQARKYGERTALSYRDYDLNKWMPISWNRFAMRVRQVSRALLKLGVGVQENIAVFSQNKPESLYVDFGAYGIRVVTIPFYATSSGAQVTYMLNDAEVRFLFVGEQQQYDTAFSVISLANTLEKIIIFDKKVKKNDKDTSPSISTNFSKAAKTPPTTTNWRRGSMRPVSTTSPISSTPAALRATARACNLLTACTTRVSA